MAIDMQTVKLHGFTFPDYQFTYNLASAMAKADVGRPVAFDATAANRVKAGADGNPIYGVLLSYEDRLQEGIKVGAVARKFAARFKVKASDALAVGDIAVCAGNGEVRKWITGTDAAIPAAQAGVEVTEVADGYATVMKI